MGVVDSRVIRSVGVGRAAAARVLSGPPEPAPARILPGLLKLAPGKDLVGGSRFVPLLFVVLFLALLQFNRASVLPWLISLAMLGVVVPVAQTARAYS